MPSIKLSKIFPDYDSRYLVIKARQNGTAGHYWQPPKALRAHGWKAIKLGKDLPEAVKQADEMNKKLDAWRGGSTEITKVPYKDSLEDVIKRYKKTRLWTRLRERTQRDYNQKIRQLLEALEPHTPVKSITAQVIENYYEKKAFTEGKLAQANGNIRVLRLVLNWATRMKIIADNPASKARLIAPEKGFARIWTHGEMEHMVKIADKLNHPSIGTAVMLNYWLGQREGDILALTRDQIADGRVRITQSKKHKRVDIPLDSMPEVMTRLDSELKRLSADKTIESTHVIIYELDKQPYKERTFRTIFSEVRTEAAKDVPGCAELFFEHLRHTAVTEMGDAGCSEIEISSITGHSLKTIHSILEHYLIKTKVQSANAMRKRRAASVKAITVETSD